ncbi:sigma factor [Ralstonia pickettii]|uniref:sigma factor n=1 Tax=Ralstonia pickettii TaxID=329 RepID=UPI000684C780|nr:sigma factor [Ralstonia pickettii]
MSFEADLLVWLPHLQRYARALTGNPGWAHDLVQDTLERTLNRSGLWRHYSSKQCARWLTLLRNLFIDQLHAPQELAVKGEAAVWEVWRHPPAKSLGWCCATCSDRA